MCKYCKKPYFNEEFEGNRFALSIYQNSEEEWVMNIEHEVGTVMTVAEEVVIRFCPFCGEEKGEMV